jgi:hypothetical protein
MSDIAHTVVIEMLQAQGKSAPYIAGYLVGLDPTGANPYRPGTWHYADWEQGRADAGHALVAVL